MAEIERDGDDVLIRMKTDELEALVWTLEKTGNSACRECNRYESGSLMYNLKLTQAQSAWDWAENLSIPTNNSHSFTVKVK